MILKLKLQYFDQLMWRVDSLEKTDAGKDWGQEEKGMTEDKMAGWHHRLDGHEFEWTPGVGDGKGGLVCCNSWGRKESDTSEWLNWTETLKTELMSRWRPRFHIDYTQWANQDSTKNALETELSLEPQPTEGRMEVVAWH